MPAVTQEASSCIAASAFIRMDDAPFSVAAASTTRRRSSRRPHRRAIPPSSVASVLSVEQPPQAGSAPTSAPPRSPTS